MALLLFLFYFPSFEYINFWKIRIEGKFTLESLKILKVGESRFSSEKWEVPTKVLIDFQSKA